MEALQRTFLSQSGVAAADGRSASLPFFKSAYQKARLTYLFALLFVVRPLGGARSEDRPWLGTVGLKDFPAEGWALLAALILTGVALPPIR